SAPAEGRNTKRGVGKARRAPLGFLRVATARRRAFAHPTRPQRRARFRVIESQRCHMCRRWAVLLAILALAASDARADTVADFYRGKLIKVVVGFASGGGYDVYARLLARHFGKYIPGNPSLVVQNMPGAGGLRAANFVYAAAPKDGTTIGTFSRDMPLLAVLGAN